MNRRGFLRGILAAGVAPFVVTTAGVLMPVRRVWTLADWSLSDAQRAEMFALLMQTNEILADVSFAGIPLVGGYRTASRVGLPDTFWRAMA